MKKTILIALMLLTSVMTFAQDTIITNNNEIILCKISKLTPMNIFYTEKFIEKSLQLVDVKKHTSKKPIFPDVIFTTDGETIKCRIISYKNDEIYYTFGENFHMSTINVKYIKHVITNNQNINQIKNLALKTQEVKINDELFYIRNNIGKFHKQLKNGTILSGVGIGVSLLSIPLHLNYDSEIGVVTSVIGGALILVGGIIRLDSYKYLKNASVGFGGNNIVVKYVF